MKQRDVTRINREIVSHFPGRTLRSLETRTSRLMTRNVLLRARRRMDGVRRRRRLGRQWQVDGTQFLVSFCILCFS